VQNVDLNQFLYFYAIKCKGKINHFKIVKKLMYDRHTSSEVRLKLMIGLPILGLTSL
jgi:hypothetical protein